LAIWNRKSVSSGATQLISESRPPFSANGHCALPVELLVEWRVTSTKCIGGDSWHPLRFGGSGSRPIFELCCRGWR